MEGIDRMATSLPVSPSNLPWVLMVAIFGLAIASWFAGVWVRPRIILWWRARRLQAGSGMADDCSYLYKRALNILRHQGFRRENWQTAEEFAASIDSALVRRRWDEIRLYYNAARFGWRQRRGSAVARACDVVAASALRDFDALSRCSVALERRDIDAPPIYQRGVERCQGRCFPLGSDCSCFRTK